MSHIHINGAWSTGTSQHKSNVMDTLTVWYSTDVISATDPMECSSASISPSPLDHPIPTDILYTHTIHTVQSLSAPLSITIYTRSQRGKWTIIPITNDCLEPSCILLCPLIWERSISTGASLEQPRHSTRARIGFPSHPAIIPLDCGIVTKILLGKYGSRLAILRLSKHIFLTDNIMSVHQIDVAPV